jgi:hypothetical protein
LCVKDLFLSGKRSFFKEVKMKMKKKLIALLTAAAMSAAEEKAAKRRAEILAAAADDCETISAGADAFMARAVKMIVERVVES